MEKPSNDTTVIEAGLKPDRNANATAPTDVDPAEWVETLPTARQVEQGRAMLALFAEATGGERAVMWGPSIVGYGELHYTYPSGREGDMARVGFSPRKANLVLYGIDGAPESEQLLARLGKHRRSVACIYVNKLADVDLDVLRDLVAAGWRESEVHEKG